LELEAGGIGIKVFLVTRLGANPYSFIWFNLIAEE
jgi:hypothetical protein